MFSASFRIKESMMWKRSFPEFEVEDVAIGRIESMSNLLLLTLCVFSCFRWGG